MAEEIAFENKKISNSEGLVTLTLDRAILHTIVHYLSTSTYMPNCMQVSLTCVTRWRTDLDPVSTLGELLGGEMILSLNHAHFSNTFKDLVSLLRITLFHLLGWSELFHQFFRHWNVLLHAQFQRIPVLQHSKRSNSV